MPRKRQPEKISKTTVEIGDKIIVAWPDRYKNELDNYRKDNVTGVTMVVTDIVDKGIFLGEFIENPDISEETRKMKFYSWGWKYEG